MREKYQILNDITLRLLKKEDMPGKLDDKETVVYTKMFKLSFRLPIQPYFAQMLVRLGWSPGQQDPNGLRILSGIYVVWTEQSKIEPYFKEFTYLYMCNEHGVGHKACTILCLKSNSRIVLDLLGLCKG